MEKVEQTLAPSPEILEEAKAILAQGEAIREDRSSPEEPLADDEFADDLPAAS